MSESISYLIKKTTPSILEDRFKGNTLYHIVQGVYSESEYNLFTEFLDNPEKFNYEDPTNVTMTPGFKSIEEVKEYWKESKERMKGCKGSYFNDPEKYSDINDFRYEIVKITIHEEVVETLVDHRKEE